MHKERRKVIINKYKSIKNKKYNTGSICKLTSNAINVDYTIVI